MAEINTSRIVEMCKKGNLDETDLFESLDKYNEEWQDKLNSTQSSLRDLFNVSNKIASSALDRSVNIFDEVKSIFKESDDDNDVFLKDVKNLDKFIGSITGGLVSNPFNINYKPLSDKTTGYWAYPSPSSEVYDACKEKSGLSVWDEQGYWRCLFPRSQIPVEKLGKVLTKEDVLQDVNNEKGLFFQDFNKYLDWKSNMKKALREEKLQRLAERKQRQETQLAESNLDFKELKKNEFESLNVNEEGKRITGTKELLSSYFVDGVKTESRKRYEYYDDGSYSVKELNSKFDESIDSKPVTEEKFEKFPAKKSGWFWDNSDE